MTDAALYRAAKVDRGLATLLAGSVFAELRRLKPRWARAVSVTLDDGVLSVVVVPRWFVWPVAPLLWLHTSRLVRFKMETLKLWLPTTTRVRPQL